MGRMQAIGMSWTYLSKYRSVDEELKAFDAVSLKRSARCWTLSADRVTTFALGPLRKLERK